MAITNAEMAAAWGDLLGLTPEKITELAGLLDQWALGGARLATLARLTTDVSTFNDAAIRMVHDWYGGAADGGPNGDGVYPLMNSDAEVFLLPSPAKIMAGVSGLDPKGELASTGDLPETGAQGDLWVIGGAAWVWSVSAGAWVNMGPFRGPQGQAGVISGATISMLAPGAAPTVTLGGTPSDRTVAFGLPAAADGDDGVTPNVSAAVTMIAPGQAALVTRSGPDSAPVFTFQLPRSADGLPGREVEMQAGVTHMQWRYVGETAWTNLYAKADLQGERGLKGDAFEFDAKPATLAGRAAYDAEAEGFTVLVMDTGMVFARVSATPGVWSEGFPFGQTQNAILTALSELNATPGLLYQEDGSSFSKRAIGAASDADVLDRQAADGRYRLQGAGVPMAEVSGLTGALEEKADAAATLVLLGGKADKADTYTKSETDGRIPAKATGSELRAGTDDVKFATAKSLNDADAWVEVTISGAWAPNFAAGRNFSVILSGALTFNAPTNMKDGQSGAIRFQQDATGGRTIGVNAAIKKVGAYTLSTSANAVDRCGYIVKGTVLELTALEKGIG